MLDDNSGIEVGIEIDGMPASRKFIKLEWRQVFNDHHTFTLVMDAEPHTMARFDTIHEYVGKRISFEFRKKTGTIYSSFKGIIDAAFLELSENRMVTRIFKGYSITSVLDKVAESRIFMNMTLSEVVSDQLEKKYAAIGKDLVSVNIRRNKRQPCIHQYKETFFSLLRRKTNETEQWFYFDGEVLQLGKPNKEQSVIPMTMGTDFDALKWKVNAVSTNISYSGYNHFLDEGPFEATGEGQSSMLAGSKLVKSVVAQERHTGDRHESGMLPLWIEEKKELEEVAGTIKDARMGSILEISGRSRLPTLRVGNLVQLKFPDGSDLCDRILLTEVVFSLFCDSKTGQVRLMNEFKGIDGRAKANPFCPAEKIHTYTEFAKVHSTDDPEGKGRVMVEFLWPVEERFSQWIPVSTGYAGRIKNGKQTYGLNFIPEVGDIVLIDYVYSNPDLPYVDKALFNEKNHLEDNRKNNIKRIASKGGNQLVFWDGSDNRHLQIDLGNSPDRRVTIIENGKDKGIYIISDSKIVISGPEILLDGENISIKAKERIELTAKDVTIKAESALAAGGNSIAIGAGDKINVAARETTVGASSRLELKGAQINEATQPGSPANVNVKLNAAGKVPPGNIRV